jgi:hypothetical protein
MKLPIALLFMLIFSSATIAGASDEARPTEQSELQQWSERLDRALYTEFAGHLRRSMTEYEKCEVTVSFNVTRARRITNAKILHCAPQNRYQSALLALNVFQRSYGDLLALPPSITSNRVHKIYRFSKEFGPLVVTNPSAY